MAIKGESNKAMYICGLIMNTICDYIPYDYNCNGQSWKHIQQPTTCHVALRN
jgi:hypothetical protein